MAQDFFLIAVGKLQNEHLQALENEYLKRLTFPKLNVTQVKAEAEDKEQEAKNILQKIKELVGNTSYELILLSEEGKTFTSSEFSFFLEKKIQTGKLLIFVIGGAMGHTDTLKKLAHHLFSLSPLTFPHKLARLLFVEQYYRAQTIRTKHPYHH
ncbi:MAG: 23S rRNA (pseudouridine(1915)-N(3))-methyltransferase RlmH [Bacteriovoracaceae bacterium]|nr:23S rRNA (pseudouridine(1915)-N(3))-methyltransferase RlmH [Bacteriovoracaceae bacterium]